jgi:hypothetical protein
VFWLIGRVGLAGPRARAGHILKWRAIRARHTAGEKVSAMRVLFRARMNTEKSNEAIRNGTLGKLMQSSMEQVKPEAAYFTTDEGQRTCYMVFDMQDSSEMPAIAEPFFLELGADVTYTPVMNPEDMQKGLSALGR